MKNLIPVIIVSLLIQVNNLCSQDKPIDCDFLVSSLNSKIVATKNWVDETFYVDLGKETITAVDRNPKSDMKTDCYKYFFKGSFSSQGKTEYLLLLCYMNIMDNYFDKHDGDGVCIAFLLDDKFKQIKGPVDLPYRFEENDSLTYFSDKFIRKNLKEPSKIDIDGDGKDEFYFEGFLFPGMGWYEKQLFVYSGNFEKLLSKTICYGNFQQSNTSDGTINSTINYNVDYGFEKSKLVFNSKVEKYLSISEEEKLAFKGEYYDEYIFIDGKFIHKPDKRNFKESDIQ